MQTNTELLLPKSKELLEYMLAAGGTIQEGNFVGKSGGRYNIETDLRNSMTTFGASVTFAEKLYAAIEEYGAADATFIGVPETGTLLSFFLNLIKYNKSGKDFVYNMLRDRPKRHQCGTDSVFTVLPSNTAIEYTLIEDDVVTGKTLMQYLAEAIDAGLKIKHVVTVFFRSSYQEGVSDIRKQIKELYGIDLIVIFDVDTVLK